MVRGESRAGRLGTATEILVLTALAKAAQPDPAGALATLERALTLAAPESYIRIFLDEGPPLAGLLAQLPPSPYRDQLLAAFPDFGFTILDFGLGLTGKSKIENLKSKIVEPFSERELEVLRLMAEGYSNREIADKLIFTVATAKKHAEHIYGKLGVRSRTQAVTRAQELNLI